MLEVRGGTRKGLVGIMNGYALQRGLVNVSREGARPYGGKLELEEPDIYRQRCS
jgi:hypothetical protein